jgi:hypothetical protein
LRSFIGSFKKKGEHVNLASPKMSGILPSGNAAPEYLPPFLEACYYALDNEGYCLDCWKDLDGTFHLTAQLGFRNLVLSQENGYINASVNTNGSLGVTAQVFAGAHSPIDFLTTLQTFADKMAS